jgi:hypothetical protein
MQGMTPTIKDAIEKIGNLKMKNQNNIEEISFDEIEQIKGAVVDPITVITAVGVAAGIYLGVATLVYNYGAHLGANRPCQQ